MSSLAPYVSDPDFTLYVGDVRDVLKTLPDESVHCVVTSPPYWGLRNYDTEGQLGLEPTPEEYVANMVAVFREVRRVLRSDGTCWLNLGDSYMARQFGWNTSNDRAWAAYHREAGDEREKAPRTGHPMEASGAMSKATGLKPKDLVGIPWRVAFALQADGWFLRSDIIWAKPNPMPESVTDRPTKSHEYVFLLAKSQRYFFDQEAVREPHSPDGRLKTVHDHLTDQSHPNYDNIGNGHERWPNGGRNIRSVWEIATQPYPEAHFATYPEALVERCIKAGSPIYVLSCPACDVEYAPRREPRCGRCEGRLVERPSVILDPFLGSGTTALVARKHERRCIGIELNTEYARLAAERLSQLSLLAEPA